MAATKTSSVSGGAKATIDHDEIREWVESHAGRPTIVNRTTRNGRGGILRIDFPGYSGEKSLEEVSWDDFFEKFEDSQLAFLYQDQVQSGRPSRFNKLVSRDTVAVSSGRGRMPKRAASPPAKKATRRSSAGSSGSAKKAASQRATRGGQSVPKRASSKTDRGSGTSSARARSTKRKASAAKTARRSRSTDDHR